MCKLNLTYEKIKINLLLFFTTTRIYKKVCPNIIIVYVLFKEI